LVKKKQEHTSVTDRPTNHLPFQLLLLSRILCS
jgi:hypothetical protein